MPVDGGAGEVGGAGGGVGGLTPPKPPPVKDVGFAGLRPWISDAKFCCGVGGLGWLLPTEIATPTATPIMSAVEVPDTSTEPVCRLPVISVLLSVSVLSAVTWPPVIAAENIGRNL